MAKIVIKEIDETTAGSPAASTDIVFIPGFANTNANVIVLTGFGVAPTTSTVGSVYQDGDTVDAAKDDSAVNPTIVSNITEGKSWTCSGESSGSYTWTASDTYFAPHPENTPILCSSVTEFESYFGTEPYQFPAADAGVIFSPATTGNFYEKDDYERSYIMAKELIFAGIPVLYHNVVVRESGKKVAPAVSQIYAELSDVNGVMTELQDKGEYTVKYITSGAYPMFEYSSNANAKAMVTSAEKRGDAVAIVDHSNIPGRTLDPTSVDSVYGSVKTWAKSLNDDAKFATMFTPWGIYNCAQAPAKGKVQVLPASFGYLMSLAKSIKTNPNWLAIAGVTRGQVPYLTALNTTNRLSNAIADSYQPRTDVSINAITNIKPYGLTIWGNRTLFDNSDKGNLTASSFLNVRNLVSDVKKVAYTAAKSLLFEQDSNILWLNFKSAVEPTLDQMMSGYGISGYKIIRVPTSEKAKVVATIKIFPMYAVEDFEITVTLADQEVTVS